jgi:type I restriction enzyme R subunit
MPSTPESLARLNIDSQLTACGWTVQDRAGMNLYAGRGGAVREFPLLRGRVHDSQAQNAKGITPP